jgi:hypothetical protein
MILNAEPYISSLPIRFGMTPAEVAAAVGPAMAVLPGVFGTAVEQLPNLVKKESWARRFRSIRAVNLTGASTPRLGRNRTGSERFAKRELAVERKS